MSNVIYLTDMTDLIKRILREEIETKKEAIKSMIKKSGLETAARVMGGINNIIDIVYDGNLIKFSEDTNTPLAYMSTDGINLYLHAALVNELGLENLNSYTSFSNPKTLGKFRYGSKNDLQFAFTANLERVRLHDQQYYRVVGSSGDSGFGYSYITKRNTLGKRYRQQIFKQIIDKYNLKPYMTVKTFY
jgi:hypothetical protein